MPAEHRKPPFRCRVCGANRYVQIKVQRSGGHWYTTPFFKCCGYSVMFDDPGRFAGTRAPSHKSGMGGDRPEPSIIDPAPNPFTRRAPTNGRAE